MIKKAKYPKTLFIGCEQYKVLFVKKLDGDTIGECDPEKKEIRILASLGPVEILRTFIHEVLHALQMEHNLKLKHKLIYSLEDPLFKFFVDNFLGG